MKKLMLIMLMVLLVGTVTAFEFDNVKNYDEETKTIDIRNSVLGIPFLQLGKVAEIKLNTPLDYHVPMGYQKVAEFEVTSYGDYSNAFKELELFDKKKENKKFTRNYDFKVRSYETNLVDDYGVVCSQAINGSEQCESVIVGNHEEQKEVWTKLTLSDFKDKEVKTIGIFTEVQEGDVVEWIPNFFGVRINEWAVWTEDLAVGLLRWFKMDEGANATGVIIDSVGNQDATNDGAVNTSGRILSAYDYSSDTITLVDNASLENTDAISIQAWVFADGLANNLVVIDKGNCVNAFNLQLRGASGDQVRFCVNANSAQTGSILSTGQWHHFVGTWDKVTVRMWVDGNNVANTSFSGTLTQNANAITIGSFQDSSQFWNGRIDEVGFWNRSLNQSEVRQLYNEGNGISFVAFGPVITLNAPVDNANFSTNSITLNATVTDDGSVQNVTLFIDGVSNETNSSGVSGDYIFEKVIADGIHNWSIGAVDSDDAVTNSSTRIFTIDTTAPIITNQNITEAGVGGIVSVHIINTNLTFTWNVEDTNLDTCTFNHDGNVTVNCTVNTTSFNITDFSNRNLTFFANDTFGQESSVSVGWNYNVSQFVSTFSASTFETKTETFQANITLGADLNGSTISNVRFFYNGSVNTGASAVNTAGQNFNLSHTIDIPLIGTTSSEWFFSFDADGENVNTTTETQTVTELLFQLCNATLSTQFINLSFRNETVNEEVVTAAISSSTWVFFLGDGLINKTLIFSNATENLNYTFCSSAVTDILFTTSTLAYTNSISQQRIFEPSLLTLTNITDARILFLLPTVDGLFSTFRTEDTLGNTIIGTIGTITRILNGVLIGITSDSTDGSGLVIYFLDPDITYTATFSKSGFVDNTFSFVPTTDLRTVIMGSVVAPAAGSNISLGMSYIILPTNTTLNNGTDITFSFNVSSVETITFMGFTISNDTTTFLSVNQAGDGFISGTINTGNNNTLSGVFTITTINETIILTRTWKIEQGFIGDYSIFNQLTLFLDYGFKDFIRLLMVIATLAIVMIFMSREIGIDEEVKMVVAILIVWAFSVVGWLDTGVAISNSSTSINDLSQFSNQYGIAIVSTVAAAYFILRRAFRQI